jgi:hypothetical protein
MAEPDPFAEFNPQPAGVEADPYAEFNPSPLPKTAPSALIPHALMRRFDAPWSGGASPIRFLNETALPPALEAAGNILRAPDAVLGSISKRGDLPPEEDTEGTDPAQTVATGGLLAGVLHPFARQETFASSEFAKRYAAEQFRQAAATPGFMGGLPRGLLGIAGAAGAIIASGPELAASLLTTAREAYRRGLTPQEETEFAADTALLEIGGGDIFRKGVDHSIGVLPKEKDFQTAAQVIAQRSGGTTTITINGKTQTFGPDPAIIADKAIRLHDEFGIHPAEVAHDAARDPEVADSMLSRQIADLPRKYTAGEKSEDTKLDEEAGVRPVAPELPMAPPATEPPPAEPAAAPQPATPAGVPATAVPAPAEPAVAAAPEKIIGPKAPRGRRALPPEHWDLLEFLASKGGIDPTPELRGIYGLAKSDGQKEISKASLVPSFGPLLRKGGMSPDRALELAVDSKYFLDETDETGRPTKLRPDDLLDVIEEQRRTKERRLKVGQEGIAKPKTAELESERKQVGDAAYNALENDGIETKKITPTIRERMIDILTAPEETRDPGVAWERAVMEAEHEAHQAGDVAAEPENIPGWDVELPDERGPAPEAGGPVEGGRGQPAGGGLGEPARPTGEPNREPPEEGGAALGPSVGAASIHDMPPIGVGGAGAPRANPYFTYDEPKFSDRFQKAIAGWQKTFQPELVSDRALQADPLFAEYKSRSAAEHASIIARAEAHHQFWRGATDTERIDYIDRLERRAKMPEKWKLEAYRHRVLLDEADRLEHEFGSKAGYTEDYFPHMWLDPDKARGFVNTKVAQLGPNWFQKERAFDIVREGLDAGLRLKWTNPEDLVTYRLLSGADMRERMRLLQGLEEQGLAKPVKVTTLAADTAVEPTMLNRMGIDTRAADELMRNGWSQINAPNREAWLLSPDVQPLWKNAVEAKGLWANEGAIGGVFRGWMGLKAAWVPVKLGLSLFHPLHVVGINIAQGMGRGMVQLIKTGDLGAAAESITQGFNMFPSEGRAAMEAWRVPANERTPAQAAQVDLMTRGGFVPQMTEEMRINAKRGLEEAWDKSQYFGIAYQGLRRFIEKVQAPIFEKWIPSLKTAAYMNDAQALLARRPELLDDPIQQGVALRTIAKSVDNRFGQMFYGNLFWDRYVKDAGIGTFLSLGWQTGGIREFGGAFMGPAFRTIDRALHGAPSETRATITDAQNKLSFALAYVGTMMLVNGMMSWGLSGQPPEGLDWFLARVGGTNPDGSPRRITNMSYLREVPMLLKHIQEQGGNVVTGAGEMLYNKMMIEPIREMWNNRDYYGSDIWDVNGPIYMKAVQALKHVFGDNFLPITFTGAQRALLTGGQWYEALLAGMGFGPAPSYAARDATQNRIAYLYDRHVAPFARPEDSGEKSRARIDIRSQLLQAQKSGDQEGLQKAANKWMENGGSRLSLSNVLLHIPSDVTMFRALPQADQEAIMKGATPEQQAKYKPYLKSDIVVRAANLTMQAEMQRKNNDNVGAAATEQLLNSAIVDAARNGQITNMTAFRRSLAQQLVARHSPDIAAIMAQPKKDRARYQLQLQAPQ